MESIEKRVESCPRKSNFDKKPKKSPLIFQKLNFPNSNFSLGFIDCNAQFFFYKLFLKRCSKMFKLSIFKNIHRKFNGSFAKFKSGQNQKILK
jgi:hypothetical protein